MIGTHPLCPSAVNAAGETALDVARRLKHTECEELVGGRKDEEGDAQAGQRGLKHRRGGRGMLGPAPPS